ncbi:VC0807 family protein [Amycolatopsis taiwanensis]|uniref:Intracellular septation protein A n=1 Tax=Amycolatopsis taiwanensis TaxID=342230 RepID=A0A9W6RAY8_9PSEU|nr:VC0807 family protein [Amycolatopsis taiwanensis]GLY70752.1 hypothetical protein Atai01_73710 [Amycolatopsis taiwanensis]
MTVDPALQNAAGSQLRKGLVPLVVDVVLPVGSYYLLSKAFGLSELVSLALSSAIPAARTIWGIVAQRQLNPLAALMLVVNVAALLLSLLSGDPRLMLAKDSGVSSVIGISILVSAFLGRPIMSTVIRPMFGRGQAARLAVWDRLSADSAHFRRAERTYSIVWGSVLLVECVARVVGAYTLPIDTMVWLGNVILLVALVLAFRLGHLVAMRPMKTLLIAELATN